MKKLIFGAIIALGLTIGLKTNIFDTTIEKVQASPPTNFSFVPESKLNLKLNLETGKALVESSYPVASTNVEVNHPTKVIEKVKTVEKPIIKKVIETKIVKVAVPMKLSAAKLSPKKLSLPERVNK